MTSNGVFQRYPNTVFPTVFQRLPTPENKASNGCSFQPYTLKGISAARYGAGAACDLVPMPGNRSGRGTGA